MFRDSRLLFYFYWFSVIDVTFKLWNYVNCILSHLVISIFFIVFYFQGHLSIVSQRKRPLNTFPFYMIDYRQFNYQINKPVLFANSQSIQINWINSVLRCLSVIFDKMGFKNELKTPKPIFHLKLISCFIKI